MYNIDSLIKELEIIRDSVSKANWTIMEFVASGDIEESNNLWMPFECYCKLQNAEDNLTKILVDLDFEKKGEKK